MLKVLQPEYSIIVISFAIIFLYYNSTSSLKIDKEFYSKSVDLLKNNFISLKEPPFSHILFGIYIVISQYFTDFFKSNDNNTILLQFFNILISLIISLNLFLMNKFFTKSKNKISNYFYLVAFLLRDENFVKINILNSFLFQFTLLNLLLYCKKRKIPYFFCLGLFSFSSFLGFLIFIVDSFFAITLSYSKNMKKQKNLNFFKKFFKFILIFLLLVSFYVFSFAFFINSMKNGSKDVKKMSLEYKSGILNLYEPCDKHVLDRALVTIINRNSQSMLYFDEEVIGSKEKNENSIFQLVKVHVTNESYNPSDQENFFIKNGDYVKLLHYTTKKYLRSELKKDSKDKFTPVELRNKEEQTDDNDFFMIYFDEPNLQARTSVFTLKHVTSGKFLSIKNDGISVSVSNESNKEIRKFYIEDCYNEAYFKYNIKDPRINEKGLFFPKLSFIRKFMEYHSVMLKKESRYHLINKIIFEIICISWVITMFLLNDLSRGYFNNYFCFRISVFKSLILSFLIFFGVIFYEVDKVFLEYFVLILMINFCKKIKEYKRVTVVFVLISFFLKNKMIK